MIILTGTQLYSEQINGDIKTADFVQHVQSTACNGNIH